MHENLKAYTKSKEKKTAHSSKIELKIIQKVQAKAVDIPLPKTNSLNSITLIHHGAYA